MLTAHTLAAALIAGIAYVLTPGPGFMAILSSASVQPIAAGVRFTGGLLVGSTGWFVFTLATFAGAGHLPDGALDTLAVACAFYLAYLGARLILASARGGMVHPLTRPFREGLLISCTNPKAYPVLTSVFGAFVLVDTAESLTGSMLLVFLAGIGGFATGYGIMLGISRIPIIRKLYARNMRIAASIFGLVFWAFAIQALAAAVA